MAEREIPVTLSGDQHHKAHGSVRTDPWAEVLLERKKIQTFHNLIAVTLKILLEVLLTIYNCCHTILTMSLRRI